MATFKDYLAASNPFGSFGLPWAEAIKNTVGAGGQVMVQNLDTGQMEPGIQTWVQLPGVGYEGRDQQAQVLLPKSVAQQFAKEASAMGGTPMGDAIQLNESQLKEIISSPAFLMIAGGIGGAVLGAGAAGGAAGAGGAGVGLESAIGADVASGAFGAAESAALGGGGTLSGLAADLGGIDPGFQLAPDAAGNLVNTPFGAPGTATAGMTLGGAAPTVGGGSDPGFQLGPDASGSLVNQPYGAAGTATEGLTLGGAAAGAGTAGTASSAASAISKIMNGTATADDWLSVLGKAAPGLIGAFAANQQGGALSDLASKEDARIREFMAYGKPSRDRYEETFSPNWNPLNMPGLQPALDVTSDTILRRLSATGGNPYGNPGGLIEANKAIAGGVTLPAIQNYRNQNASTGGYGAFNTMAAGGGNTNALNLAAGGADTNTWNALGSAASSVFNPQPAPMQWSDLLKMFKPA